MDNDSTIVVHHDLFLYLTCSRDDYWISEGEEIRIRKVENGWVHYETIDRFQEWSMFPEYFLSPENSYDAWRDSQNKPEA
jgi:hypothetical protein